MAALTSFSNGCRSLASYAGGSDPIGKQGWLHVALAPKIQSECESSSASSEGPIVLQKRLS